MVSDSGVVSPADAISDTAASTGTVGWQTLITCSDVVDELADVVDVVIEPEFAGLARDHARIDPVGDVHLVVGEQGAHGVAQQGRVVAGERRDHEHDGVVLHRLDAGRFVAEPLETQQIAERLGQCDLLQHRGVLTVRPDLRDAELGLLVVLADPIDQLAIGREPRRTGQVREPASGLAEHLRAGLAPVRERRHHGALGFVQGVQHGRNPEEGLARVYCTAALRVLVLRCSRGTPLRGWRCAP